MDPLPKATFYNLCLMHDLDYSDLSTIAKMANVPQPVVDAMFTTVATVRRADAQKVLTAFSEYFKERYTLDTVRVALLPTFQDLNSVHHFDLVALSTGSGVPYAIIDMMLADAPVSEHDARLVLQMASRLSGNVYMLENVDVQITNGGEADAEQQ